MKVKTWMGSYLMSNWAKPAISRRYYCLTIIVIWAIFSIFSGCSKETVDPLSDSPSPDFKMNVIGYMPDYRINAVSSVAANLMTHLIFFSIEPTSEGFLELSRFDPAARTLLSSFKLENKNLKVIIAVGGWGRSQFFPVVTTDDLLRTRFVEQLTAFCRSNYFNGIDLDWEFPSNSAERLGYAQLITQLGDSCKANNLSLSVALNVYQTIAPEVYPHIDRVHIMSYDHSGRHATYTQAVDDVENFLARGIPPEKLYLGIPFYGRKITDFSQSLSYREIVTRYHPDEYIDEVDGYYFNNINTVKDKSMFARGAELGGVMVWEIGQDVQGEGSLLETIYQTAVME